MTDDVRCPYCGLYNEINHDDGYGYEEDTYHEEECRHCDKTYHYTTTVSYWYDAYPAPCLNEGDHNFKEMNYGYPEEYFKHRYKCQCCEKEIKIVPSCKNCKLLEKGALTSYFCMIKHKCYPEVDLWELDINFLNRKN